MLFLLDTGFTAKHKKYMYIYKTRKETFFSKTKLKSSLQTYLLNKYVVACKKIQILQKKDCDFLNIENKDDNIHK